MLYVAAPAGLVAGLLLTAIQQVEIVPLIRQAEAFESAGHGHAPSLLATAVANVVLATAFALLLAAAQDSRPPLGWRTGLLWGVAGYAAFFVAPSLGLPPELPGADAAPLRARQVWWWSAVLSTAAGLWMLVFARHATIRVVGVLVIALPHLVGAPSPVTSASTAPMELSRDFVRATWLANAAFWLALGAIVGWLRRSRPPRLRAQPPRLD